MVFVRCVINTLQTWSSNLHQHSNSGIQCLLLLPRFKAIRSHFFQFNYRSRSRNWEERAIPGIRLSCFPSAVFLKLPPARMRWHSCALSHELSKVITRKVLQKCWYVDLKEAEAGVFRSEWLKNTCRAYQWRASVVLKWNSLFPLCLRYAWQLRVKIKNKKRTDERIEPFTFARFHSL